MIVLREQPTAQTLRATIQGTNADTIVLRDEEKNTEVTINAVFSIDKYYAVTSVIFPIKENKYYTLTIKNGNSVVYKDKIFCTNQTVADYSINKNEYVQNVTTNEFIIYE